tara:strand:- start:474 stop:2489 length:2016 start_codon:yes stop_codon:yes gene_type:complete
MFEVTRADDGLIFNPYVRTQCVLKQDGFILFQGYLRLIDVKDKDGEISYNVNLYSEVIVLADVLKDKTFTDLSFLELEHTYNITNIKNSWESVGAGNGLLLTNSLTNTSFAYDSVTGFNNTQVLKYPYIDWNHQLEVDGGVPTLTNTEVGFRPCIQLKYLIDKIFADTLQFNYTSEFFNSTDFKKLFMDFNWGENDYGAIAQYSGFNNRDFTDYGFFSLHCCGWKAVEFDDSVSGDDSYWDATLHRFTSPANNLNVSVSFLIEIFNDVLSAHSVQLRIAHYNSNGSLVAQFGYADQSIPSKANRKIIGSFNTIVNEGDYIVGEYAVPSYGDLWLTNESYLNIDWNNVSVDAYVLLNEIRGELGQWDFLKGIMTMFNLVTLVDENDPNNILIEPYKDIFINSTNCSTTTQELTLACRSIQHDWTDKVDVSEMELKPLSDLNRNTTFQFAEDEDDFLFGVYKAAQNGHLYGSEDYESALTPQNLKTIFQGIKEITAEPFAASVVAPLMDIYHEFVVPRIYARDDAGVCTSFENSPRILYNNGIRTMATDTYKVKTQNAVAGETLDHFLQFSHLSEIPSVSLTSTDFYFASHQLIPDVGVAPIDNLFFTYWLPYIGELYNADTRMMTLKVNLSPSDVASFKFYDTIFIKNRVFRCNRIDYKPNDLATVEFILIP